MMNPDSFYPLVGCGFAVVLGAGLVVTSLNTDIQASKQAGLDLLRSQYQMEYEAKRDQVEGAKATQRYQNGCVVLDRQIQDGLTVTGVPINTAVCDAYGLTAITTPGGEVTDIARTTDTSVIQGRLAQP